MDISVDHEMIIDFLESIWDLLNYGNILFYAANFACLFLCYLVFRHMGDDDREMKTIEEDPEINV